MIERRSPTDIALEIIPAHIVDGIAAFARRKECAA